MRVVIAEDNALMRAGVAELLRAQGMEVVAEVGDADGLVEVACRTRPDVVVVDVRMPPTHTVEGLRAARQLREELGEGLGILVLSNHVESAHALELMAGTSTGIGYLLKERVLRPEDLADAIREVGSGGSALDPVVVGHLLRRRSGEQQLESLTPRERQVLELIAEGRSNRSVAAELVVSEKTVESCTTRIFDKLGLEDTPSAHRRVQAVLAYLRNLPAGS